MSFRPTLPGIHLPSEKENFKERRDNRPPAEEKSVDTEPDHLAGKNIVVLIPALNEERSISRIVRKARKYAGLVIVVDDGSTDATGELAARAGAFVIRHPHNRGKGSALNTGFQYARTMLPDVLVTIDGDGQHLPDEIYNVAMPVLTGGFDIVVGSRYISNKNPVPQIRVLGHGIFNWINHSLTSVPASDSQNGFRAFSPRAVEEINFHSSGFAVESEIQFLAQKYGLKWTEVGVNVLYLDKPKRPVLFHGLLVLIGILNLFFHYRPLLFFGLPGLALFLGGLGWGFDVIDTFSRDPTIPEGHAIVSILLLVVGLSTMSTGFILHSWRRFLINYHKDKKEILVKARKPKSIDLCG
jgi:glycosyltransferase involved in cell wall biosynthesis